MSQKNKNSFQYKRVLVTGGGGFIGSSYINSLTNFSPQSKILNLDKITYATSENTLKELDGLKNYSFIKSDLINEENLREIYEDFQPDLVVNFAAESHVDNSIGGPVDFIKSNFVGVLNQLEILRSSPLKNNCLFHQISTDEVFGDLNLSDQSFTEDHPYRPSSPYSSSKASANHLIRAWSRTYNLNHLITNCSNNFGPRQHPEKIIPKIILNSFEGKAIPIYGDGLNIRDWLFVEDHISALLLIQSSDVINDTFNIGGGTEMSNLELLETIFNILSEKFNIQNKGLSKEFVKDREGHDRRYSINSSKLKSVLGWNQNSDFNQSLVSTIEWYKNNSEWWKIDPSL